MMLEVSVEPEAAVRVIAVPIPEQLAGIQASADIRVR
jgi:hypothetical protein